MKHRSKGRKFGRVRSQRTALFKSLVGSLVMHEHIETTEAKAKELRGVIDKVITKARRVDTASKNRQMEIFRKLEADVPHGAIQKLSSGMLERFGKRTSGYTRVIKLVPRKSDSAKMAIIEFVDQVDTKGVVKKDKEEKKQEVEEKSEKKNSNKQ